MPGRPGDERQRLVAAAVGLSKDVGKKRACRALAIPRATFYRYLKRDRGRLQTTGIEKKPPLSLAIEEQRTVIEILHSERFQDKAPYEIYATLLDEGRYLCSIRTMYRILATCHGSVTERRRIVSRSHYVRPELIATAPNQVWSWDITKLKGPVKWTYFHLYVIIDIFSRYVVGWMVAHREQDILARRLIAETSLKHGIEPGQLTVHADRGSSMKSKVVAHLLADLGITKTHSRPYQSNDNPFSEAQFKTLKYCPEFPERFGSIQDARSFCQPFFNWYNNEHRHTGIALMTPEQVHYGMAHQVQQSRAKTLKDAFIRHPDRFKGTIPKPLSLPEAVWINKPSPQNPGA